MNISYLKNLKFAVLITVIFTFSSHTEYVKRERV